MRPRTVNVIISNQRGPRGATGPAGAPPELLGPFANSQLAAAAGVEEGDLYRKPNGETAWRLPRSYGLAALSGDSITATGSHLVFGSTGTNCWPGGYQTALRTSLGHRLQYAKNSNTNLYTYAISGAKSSWFTPGGTQRALFEAALASSADSLMMLLGANDLVEVGVSADTTAGNIVSLWDEALAAGKWMVGLEILPVRADHPSAAFFPAKQQACNAILKEAAEARRIQWIEWASQIASGIYADPQYLSDTVHPNMAGGIKLGQYAATQLSDADGDSALVIPANGSSSWKTLNPYGTGTPGPGVAGNWGANATSGVSVSVNKVARTDGVPGNWHDITFSGMDLPGIKAATTYGQIFAQNFSFSASPGDSLRCVAEIEMQSDFWGMALEMHASSYKAGDYGTNGGLSALTNPPPRVNGFLWTEPYSFESGTSGLALLRVYGNGTIRVGRLGIYKP